MAYSVSDAVLEVMRDMQPLKYAFERDLVNYSALARKIQPMISLKLGEEVSLDAIIMAIRRNAKTFWSNTPNHDVFNLLKECKLDLRTGLLGLYVQRTPDNYKTLVALEHKVNSAGSGGKMYVIQRSEELSIVALSSLEKELVAAVGAENVLMKKSNLALLTLTMPPKNVDVSGLMELIAHSFSALGVSVFLYFNSLQKSSFLFDESKASLVYEKFSRLVSQSKLVNASSKS